MPYSIGYSDLIDATKSSLPRASIINKYGNVVAANGNSVTYAVMELGGSLDAHFNALLEDGASANAWPLTGYTYFIIRTKTHLGSCDQRKAAMNFLYNFYYSDAVTQIALKLGYATLPAFIRNIVIGQFVSTAQCSDGEYALSNYLTSRLNIMSTATISGPLSTYMSAYYTIDSSTRWNLTSVDDSYAIWQAYISSPVSAVAAFTMFLSPATKRLNYVNKAYNLLTTPFAHIAVVPIYHLNAFSAKASGPLRLTADILAKIYTGKIQYWNDTLLQQANMENRKYLPFQRIIAVARPNSSDVNQIFTRYLAKMSPDFATAYSVPVDGDGIRSVDFSSKLQSGNWVAASDNVHVDSYVTFYDGSIGYYLQSDTPVSSIAYFCRDPSCPSIVSPNTASSLTACETDVSTFISLGTISSSYDLMFSNVANCYPIVATVDYTVLIQDEEISCALGTSGVAHQSVKFGSWMFNGTGMVQPLNSLSVAGTSASIRYDAQQTICKIKCSGQYLGYNYCSYRKCSWDDGDYMQVVSECNPKSEKRRVEYVVTPGNVCIQNTDKSPPSPVYIACDYVMMSSTTGIVCYFLSLFGITVSTVLFLMALSKRNDKKFQRSQPIFVYIFLIGAILMNLTVFVYVGTVSDITCLIRPWMYNMALTLMYGPLVMKLYTVDKLVFSTKIQNQRMNDKRVILEVSGMVLIDIIVLLAWSISNSPKNESVTKTYPGLQDGVQDSICRSSVTFTYVLLVYKCLLLGIGMFKAVTTWHVSTDISEAKQFSVAIAVGGIAYLLSLFNTLGASSSVLMQSVGIFLSGTMSVCLIMIPKLLKRRSPMSKIHPSQGGGLSAYSAYSAHSAHSTRSRLPSFLQV